MPSFRRSSMKATAGPQHPSPRSTAAEKSAMWLIGDSTPSSLRNIPSTPKIGTPTCAERRTRASASSGRSSSSPPEYGTARTANSRSRSVAFTITVFLAVYGTLGSRPTQLGSDDSLNQDAKRRREQGNATVLIATRDSASYCPLFHSATTGWLRPLG